MIPGLFVCCSVCMLLCVYIPYVCMSLVRILLIYMSSMPMSLHLSVALCRSLCMYVPPCVCISVFKSHSAYELRVYVPSVLRAHVLSFLRRPSVCRSVCMFSLCAFRAHVLMCIPPCVCPSVWMSPPCI